MKKNVWENIAKAFCIPLEREFTVEYSSKAGKYKVAGTYKFTKNGLECTDFDKIPYSDILPWILSGELSIIPKPWKPKVGDKYYYVAESISGGLYIERLLSGTMILLIIVHIDVEIALRVRKKPRLRCMNYVTH